MYFQYQYTLKDSKNSSKGIIETGVIDSTKFSSKDERITGLSVIYDRNLIIVGNRDFNVAKLKIIYFDNDEYISTGTAVDEKNGFKVNSLCL